MELRTYHLRTKRVRGHNKDLTPKIENILVKLTGSTSIPKYCKTLAVSGYVTGDPPKIEGVFERTKDNKWKELGEEEIKEAQKVVDKLLNTAKTTAKADYKTQIEEQKKVLEEQKKINEDLIRRINAVENKPKPGPKAKQKPKETAKAETKQS